MGLKSFFKKVKKVGKKIARGARKGAKIITNVTNPSKVKAFFEDKVPIFGSALGAVVGGAVAEARAVAASVTGGQSEAVLAGAKFIAQNGFEQGLNVIMDQVDLPDVSGLINSDVSQRFQKMATAMVGADGVSKLGQTFQSIVENGPQSLTTGVVNDLANSLLSGAAQQIAPGIDLEAIKSARPEALAQQVEMFARRQLGDKLPEGTLRDALDKISKGRTIVKDISEGRFGEAADSIKSQFEDIQARIGIDTLQQNSKASGLFDDLQSKFSDFMQAKDDASQLLDAYQTQGLPGALDKFTSSNAVANSISQLIGTQAGAVGNQIAGNVDQAKQIYMNAIAQGRDLVANFDQIAEQDLPGYDPKYLVRGLIAP